MGAVVVDVRFQGRDFIGGSIKGKPSDRDAHFFQRGKESKQLLSLTFHWSRTIFTFKRRSLKA